MQFPFEKLYYTSSSQGKWQWEAKAGSTSILGITGAQPLSSLIFSANTCSKLAHSVLHRSGVLIGQDHS